MASTTNVIIVGGGLGGLTAGATLSRFGKKVLVLEQHYIPGGCATSFKRKDFVMEVGLHEMDGLFDKDTKVRIFDLLDVFKHVEFIQVPELFHLTGVKPDFTFPHGTEVAQEKLMAKFPHERKGIKTYFKFINGVLSETPKIPREKWKLALIYPLMPLLFPNIVAASKISVGHWLDKHMTDDELKVILTANLLYYDDGPYTTSMLYFSTAQASYIGGGGHFIKGGSQKLSDYLAAYIQEKGGQVLLGKKVENILIEEGKAVGVQYHDAFNTSREPETVYADAVIANAAIPNVVNMLPEKYKALLQDKTKHLKEACSLISIYMGFNISLKKFGVKHYSTFFQGDDIKELKDLKPNYQGDWDKKSFVFVDYSQIDSGLAPDGKGVAVICAADYLAEWESLSEAEYKAKKEVVAQLFLTRLENHFPGILNHLDYYETGTSRTIQRYTLNPKGTAYGYAQTPLQSGRLRMAAQSPIGNMYFASAWSFPGGGFTGTIIGGFLAAMAMKEKIKWAKYDTATFIKDLRVVRLIQKNVIAENTIQLIFEKPVGFHQEAGQYAILKINNPKTNVLDMPFRSFSIVSHAGEANLRFAMRISDSSFKRSCQQMELGDEATIFGPMGQFVIQDYAKDIVFLICGIGITPVVAMLMDLESKQFMGRVFIFYSNKTKSSAAYHHELQKSKLKNYVYVPVITTISSRINGELLKSHLTTLTDFDYFLAGTSSFLSSMKTILTENGVEVLKIKEDDFG